MDRPTFPFSDDELKKIGVLGEGVPQAAAQALEMMKKRPDLLKPSLFALQCAGLQGQLYKDPGSPPLPSSPTFSDSSMTLNFPALASETTVVSEHGPDAYEQTRYCNGITGNNGCPELVHPSDVLTLPFPKPVAKFSPVPIKCIHGVFNAPLNKVWDTVAPQICDIMELHNVKWASIDCVTLSPPRDKENDSLSPVVISIGVRPASTSADTAHVVSQLVQALLRKNGVEGVVVEWREVIVQRLTSSSLL